MTTDSAIRRIVDTIKKSDFDTWKYRGLELENGMLCLLISHPNIDKAAAALNVNIGSFADPNDIPGVAHFLEHMLFMGSTKYPGENDYGKFIKNNGGYRNAFTSSKQTNYHFDINPSFLSEALDIFAQFFISPLLSPSSIDREIQAVNSEFEGDLAQDSWRISQVKRATSDPEHPYSKFTIGNNESLRTIPTQLGIDLREVLLDFYEKQYSANRMSLVVLGNQSLDDLQTMVVKSFKDVRNKQLIAQKYPADPFGETRCKTICYIVPIAETHRMTMTWATPDCQELYYCDPVSYVSFLIHHEGVGSPIFHFKKMGLALSVSCSWVADSAPGFRCFNINIDLTIEGLERWQEIVHVVYQYIAMMRQGEPKECIFRERKNMWLMNFQFSDKSAPVALVSYLASQLRDYPLSECLFGRYDMREFRPDLIAELLDKYLIPKRMRIYLVSKNFTSIASEKEKWFGTQYKQENLSDEFIKKCETCDLNDDLHVPLPNNFIPDNFQLYHNEQDTAALRPSLPRKIRENEFFRLYYTGDDFYKLPKACIYFELRNPLCYVDPIHKNMCELYVSLVNDSLSDYVYPARLGGLTHYLYGTHYGIELMIDGYNQKITVLLEAVLERMIHLKIDSQRFEILKTKRKQSLLNSRRQIPYMMGDRGRTYLIAEHRWHDDELLSCLDDITPQDVVVFFRRMFARFYVDSLMYGNLTENQSIEYMMTFQQKFHRNNLFQPSYPGMWLNHRQLALPDGCNYAYTMLNDGHCIQAIVIYLQCFHQTLENNALINLFNHLANEPCFDQLRTKEQLGYAVFSHVCRDFGVQGLQIIVQSTHKLDHVNRRIERFLDSVGDYIEQMPEKDFREKREGYMMKSMEIPKRMMSQGFQFWNEIGIHQFCFDRRCLENDFVKKLERVDLIRFYDHYISPRSRYRRKLALYIRPSAVALANAPFEKEISVKTPILEKENVEEIENSELIGSFQRLNSQEECQLFDEETSASVSDIVKKAKLILPEIVWINDVPTWKSQLSCYPLAPSYEQICIPNLYKL